MAKDKLDISTLETWLWEAACKIRGPIDASKYKDYILVHFYVPSHARWLFQWNRFV
jgi:type I restriction-modification system DNA methylase subunit